MTKLTAWMYAVSFFSMGFRKMIGGSIISESGLEKAVDGSILCESGSKSVIDGSFLIECGSIHSILFPMYSILTVKNY
ncbi:hypothetical protein [Metabacillus sp. Hm71]|uniref:hypothetical protein n=1 Tax=Metabacillus sp. Hm71 TaxID=3450743 RepID=UPI003F41EBF6